MSPEEHRMLKVGSIYVPVIMVFSMIVGAIYFTYLVTTERAQVYSEIGDIRQSIGTLADSLNRFISATQTRLDDNDKFSQGDYVVACLRQQIINPKWRCEYAPSTWKAEIE